ncbi:hypothetical protein LMH87_006095 [Akanthomyces muscarius]|uniref:Uncharacterized protein n=1 Tax=Akanthomyces muscarius TaxID=2231603 RepID=A0A9W8QQ43_AKAMU|nr:hypothetical protein LMH87_006095 [Akanthomyces muscarius]KAJ4164419.1 hypothetical protein LMH87_006095 [Akanthomyces muscarius]
MPTRQHNKRAERRILPRGRSASHRICFLVPVVLLLLLLLLLLKQHARRSHIQALAFTLAVCFRARLASGAALLLEAPGIFHGLLCLPGFKDGAAGHARTPDAAAAVLARRSAGAPSSLAQLH